MNILTGCTSLLYLWYLSDNQSKTAPVVPFLIDYQTGVFAGDVEGFMNIVVDTVCPSHRFSLV
jgi:hypothetical protein